MSYESEIHESKGAKEEEKEIDEKKERDLSRIWSWSIIVDILSLSASGRLSRSASMLLSILDPISVRVYED